METQIPNIALMVISCDKYADLWDPFFYSLNRHWPKCPFPIYMTTNHASPSYPGVRIIAVGADTTWSGNLIRALKSVPEKYVLLFIEDLFLYAPVETDRVLELANWVESTKPNYLRFNPSEPPTKYFNALVGEIEAGALYRTSTVLSLWNKEVLSELLDPMENAWEFEIKGSYRSDKFPHFYSAYTECFPVLNGVIKGKWDPAVFAALRDGGTPLGRPTRPIMDASETIRFRFHQLRSRVFRFIPWRLRRVIRSGLLRSGAPESRREAKP